MVLLWALIAAPAFAQTFPPLTGRVVDNANLLSPDQEAAIAAQLQSLEQSTGRQLVVATVPDLQGYPIEDYGYRLGRAWGIGQKGQNNGVILLVAPKERQVRIEVGYGLEPYLTDALSSLIIQQQILPHFRSGDYAGGIQAGVNAIIEQLRLPEDQAQARQSQMLDQNRQQARHHRSHIPFGLIFWLIILAFVLFSHRRRRAGPWGARSYGGSNWPIWLWAASEIARSSRGGGSGWGGGGGGGFSGGGGSFGGGGASGGW